MAGLFGLSIKPTKIIEAHESTRTEFFKKTVFWGISYIQHLGGEFSGIAVLQGSKILTESKHGLFASNFKNKVDSFIGSEVIGYCGPAEEPFFVKKSKIGPFSLCFCGNVINLLDLEKELMREAPLDRGDDIEVISRLIAKGCDIVDGIKIMNEKVKGSYSLLILNQQGVYAVRSPDGHWPLVIGQNDKAKIIASECVGFDNLGFERERDVKPGEIILLNKSSLSSILDELPSVEIQECGFFGVYTCSRGAIVHELPATLIRRNLGAALADRDIARRFFPHIIMGVPDSGISHASGGKEAFDVEMNRQIASGRITMKWVPFHGEGLIKHIKVRSYLAPTKEEREEKAHYKIVITGETVELFLQMLKEKEQTAILEDIKEKKRIILVVYDDSIVRGTQIGSNLVPKIRTMYYKKELDGIDIKVEIHLRISFPPLLSYCPYGKTTQKGETLAERLPDKNDRISELGVDGLEYNSIGDLIKVIGLPQKQVCVDCTLPAKE